MIRLVTATPGSGKTCMVIEWLLGELDKGFYKSIYCNIEGLKIMGIHKLLDDWRTVPDEHKPCLYIVDEAQYHQEFMKETTKANEVGKALSTHRHYGIDFWLITQSPKLLNPYVIENTGEHVHLYRPKKSKTVSVYWWSYAVTSMTKANFKQADDVQKWRLNPHMFQYYKSTVAVTDGKRRISHRNVSAIIVFIVIMLVIANFLRNGAKSFESMQHKDDKTLGVIDNKQMPKAATPAISPVATNATDNDKLNFECRKAENVDKQECKQWFDQLTKEKGSIQGGEQAQVQYDASKPYEQKVTYNYQVTDTPQFVGCVKFNNRYYGYTQQGTRLPVSQEDCKRYMSGDRPFNPFRQPVQQMQQVQPVQQQTPQQTQNEQQDTKSSQVFNIPDNSTFQGKDITKPSV